MNDLIGITTTVPIEIVYAAGLTPVDLNNIFITADKKESFIKKAEQAGYPRSVCGWIKGIYGAAIDAANIKRIIAVTQGDCSNTHALMETLELADVKTIPFAYPYDRTQHILEVEMKELAHRLDVDWKDVLMWKERLDYVRSFAHRIDEMTWKDETISGMENHIALVNCSDFKGDPDSYLSELKEKIADAEKRSIKKAKVRVGIIGVPPIMSDFHEIIENYGCKIVFNEVQRQFSMPFDTRDIIEQYREYTYPYSVFHRIDDIRREIEKRRINGIIHYSQSFCFRQIEDIIFRKKLQLPILSIEGGDAFETDERQKMRIQAFVEMLSMGA